MNDLEKARDAMVDYMDAAPPNGRAVKRGGILAAATQEGVDENIAAGVLTRLVDSGYVHQTQMRETPQDDLFVLSMDASAARKAQLR